MTYHDTKAGKKHPGLNFNLLDAQIEACKKAGIEVRIYVSATLETQGRELKFCRDGDTVSFTVPEINISQLVVLNY